MHPLRIVVGGHDQVFYASQARRVLPTARLAEDVEAARTPADDALSPKSLAAAFTAPTSHFGDVTYLPMMSTSDLRLTSRSVTHVVYASLWTTIVSVRMGITKRYLVVWYSGSVRSSDSACQLL